MGDVPERSPSVGPPGPERVSEIFRQYVSTQLLWGHAVARRLGLGPTDFAAMNLLSLAGPMSVAELARATGLSPSAATRVVDRLAAAGFVERASDAGDRRRVLVQMSADRRPEVQAAVEPYREASRTILADFTPAEQAAVLTWMARLPQELDYDSDRPGPADDD
ncbi:MarR family winged helix-turn-helix transcriptional regulator [Propionibacteriaceae bacterium Y2011]|uniref:MarR family winged helix-turn-helix transcriptional regulator n=1 Tax=Microlunatus sp. Y2014 TaxID=3418488 RepID=UPI003B4BEAE0